MDIASPTFDCRVASVFLHLYEESIGVGKLKYGYLLFLIEALQEVHATGALYAPSLFPGQAASPDTWLSRLQGMQVYIYMMKCTIGIGA